VRFIAEFLKESQGGFETSIGLLTTGQWLSIPLILVGVYLLGRARLKAKSV
jgi:prolipoprotein diacylglyceryltransferase